MEVIASGAMKRSHRMHKRMIRALPVVVLAVWGFTVPSQGEEGGEGADGGYEGGRGLITLEGPSGLFINPTSATLPKDAYTAQYCVFFPDNQSSLVGHGIYAGFGATDDLEMGAIANVIDLPDSSSHLEGAGPYIRYRLRKDDGVYPQLALGGYSRIGDEALTKYGIFAAAYKRVPLQEEGYLRALGFHAGIRQLWFDDDVAEDNTWAGYLGGEIQFPLRIYAVTEVTSRDSDVAKHIPYSVGLQWRAPGIAMSMAAIQNGNNDELSFYYGIGASHHF